MSYLKLLNLNINKATGILNIQEVDFDQSNNIIQLKGNVGAGKTTTEKLVANATEGRKSATDTQLYGESYEYSVKLGQFNNSGQQQDITILTRKDKGEKPESKIIVTDHATGKKITKPSINGESLTVSKLQTLIKTVLSFRMNELFSDNPVTVRNLLVDIYREQMEKYGIGITPKHINYVNSLEHKLSMAIDKRDSAFIIQRQLDAFKTSFNDEDIDVETNLYISGKDFDASTLEIQTKINDHKADIRVSNSTADKDKEIKLNAVKNVAIELTNDIEGINEGYEDVNSLIDANIDNLTNAIEQLRSVEKTEPIISEIEKLKDSYKKTIVVPQKDDKINIPEVLTNKDKFSKEIIELCEKLQEKRNEYSDILNKTTEIVEETGVENGTEKQIKIFELEKQIIDLGAEKEKEDSNSKIMDRINAWSNHKTADEDVQSIRKEIFKAYENIETGVEGLKIQAIQKDGSDDYIIKMMYNGISDSKLFNNPNNEYRSIASYSGTQRPLIGLLMHVAEMEKKEVPLLLSWLDCPVDKNTMSFLNKVSVDKKLTIFVNVTGDFDKNKLSDGDILIEGGYLVRN